MNKPTKDLLEEHEGINLMLKILKKVIIKLENKEEVKKKHLEKITEFFSIFADRCHHGKEEGILFPEIIKNSNKNGLIDELLQEHKTVRKFIRNIETSLNNYTSKNANGIGINIAINSKNYLELLTMHIKKEDTRLFPVVNKFSNKIQVEIKEQFDALEKDVIGIGKHEEYHGWLKELKKIYLN